MLEVFVAVANEDMALVSEILEMVKAFQGLHIYAAEMAPEPGGVLTEKVQKAISKSDLIVVIWSQNATRSAFVNQEVGFAKGLGKLVVPFKSEESDLRGFLVGVEWIEWKSNSRRESIGELISWMDDFRKRLGM